MNRHRTIYQVARMKYKKEFYPCLVNTIVRSYLVNGNINVRFRLVFFKYIKRKLQMCVSEGRTTRTYLERDLFKKIQLENDNATCNQAFASKLACDRQWSHRTRRSLCRIGRLISHPLFDLRGIHDVITQISRAREASKVKVEYIDLDTDSDSESQGDTLAYSSEKAKVSLDAVYTNPANTESCKDGKCTCRKHQSLRLFRSRTKPTVKEGLLTLPRSQCSCQNHIIPIHTHDSEFKERGIDHLQLQGSSSMYSYNRYINWPPPTAKILYDIIPPRKTQV